MTPFVTKFYTDRTAAETDDRCGMRFWYQRKEGGRGIVPVKEPLALMLGRETHLDLASIGQMEDISPQALQTAINGILEPITQEDRSNQQSMELLYRRLGWIAGFALYIEPMIREKYHTISIEGEMSLDRNPLFVATTPDRLLQMKANPEHIEYREYKTTISSSTKWMNSWHYAIQLHIGIKAATEKLCQKVAFGQVMGLMKGEERWSADGKRLSHPYVWGYYNTKYDKWSTTYERSSDWMPMPVWEYPGGVVEWVQKCGEDVARCQFPHSSPVFLNEMMLDEWVKRRLYRERMIHAIESICQKNKEIRAIHFERRTAQCRPAFGDSCPYLKACWNAEVNRDPLASGEFIKRTPHHQIEMLSPLEELEY